MNAYDRLTIARSKGRPTAASYISAIFTDFFELHGDRNYADDKAILGGVARLDGDVYKRQARNILAPCLPY